MGLCISRRIGKPVVGYTNKIILISEVIKSRESDLFNRITSDTGHVLYDLLPSKRNRVLRERDHEFILP